MKSKKISPKKYRVGIDVGTHSIGFCAVEVDDTGKPLKLLNSMVHVHDSGIDPSGDKAALTRKAVSGTARRMRRLYRRRRQRLAELDKYLQKHGYPIVDLEQESDPMAPWLARQRLLTEKISAPDELKRLLSIAVRHMARHRGWRSPYTPVQAFHQVNGDTELIDKLRERVGEKTFQTIPAGTSPTELVVFYFKHAFQPKLRGPEGVLQKVHQSDNANELHRIAKLQGISHEEITALIDKVFFARSPKGSAAKFVGKDQLPGQGHLIRAEKAHPVFQKFRIVSTLANLRINENGVRRHLSADELEGLTDLLMQVKPKEPYTWEEIADNLGIERHDLIGTASPGPDGEPALRFPPQDSTTERIMGSTVKWLKDWWKSADFEARGNMIDGLSNSGGSTGLGDVDDDIAAFLEALTEEELGSLDKIEVPGGRAAYSLESLQRLTDHMLTHGVDLHEARKAVFGVDDSWVPPAEEIGAPVGNPAVDRVLKQVARWLNGVEQRWGVPEAVNVEHVRSALGSERMAREYMRDLARRSKANERIVEEIHEKLGIRGKASRSDIIRYKALVRQNCQCLYCGDTITLQTLEMDHIVPRSNSASSNTMTNLVATCRRCNHHKGKQPFAVWAAREQSFPLNVNEVYERVKFMLPDSGMRTKEVARFKKAVVARLKSTRPDEEIDSRSLESVAWMARELRFRIEQHFKKVEETVDVAVYRGSLTAEARKASGFENRVNLIGGGGKTRFDRRHHAMDALTIALMDHSVAHTIALRLALRDEQWITRAEETWKSFNGSTVVAQQKWNQWRDHMVLASDLFNLALTHDRVPVCENLRLRQGSGAIHEATILPLDRSKTLGEAFTVEEIDRASTPQLWTALTRLADFDWKTGLPEDPARRIRVRGQWLDASDPVPLFRVAAASISVNGGSVRLGESIHHARIYRIEGKKTTYSMVRVYQVDLANKKQVDLFTCELPESCPSIRFADKKMRAALRDGTAVQIGFLVEGDELQINPKDFVKNTIGEFLEQYPQCLSWRVAGFPGVEKLRLRPRVLAPEGIDEDASKAAKEIILGEGWRPSVNVLFGSTEVRVVRRNALGEERCKGDKGLPSSVFMK